MSSFPLCFGDIFEVYRIWHHTYQVRAVLWSSSNCRFWNVLHLPRWMEFSNICVLFVIDWCQASVFFFLGLKQRSRWMQSIVFGENRRISKLRMFANETWRQFTFSIRGYYYNVAQNVFLGKAKCNNKTIMKKTKNKTSSRTITQDPNRNNLHILASAMGYFVSFQLANYFSNNNNNDPHGQ